MAAAVYADPAGGSSFVKVLDTEEWVFSDDVELMDVSIKGDIETRFQVSHGTAPKFTAKRRHEGVSVFVAFLADAIANHTRTAWRLDLIDASGSFTQITGTGYAKSGSASAPQDAATETFELQFDDVWTYT